MNRLSRTGSGTPSCMAVRSVRPMTAFMGVLISWLMRERNSLFARLSASDFSSASSMFAERTRKTATIIMIATVNSSNAHIMVRKAKGLE